MEQASYMQLRQHLADYIGKVKYAKERVIITQRGKVVGAFIPFDDLEILQSLEDKEDIAIFEKAKKSGKFVNWDDVKSKLIKNSGLTGNDLQSKTRKKSRKIPRKNT